MKILCVIPARMASSRFPGKPMEKINNIPMIGHCYLRSKLSSLVDDVYVATCDKIISNYILKIGGKSIMTSNVHERATERVSEALTNIEKLKNITYDFIVMVQGDEPLIHPSMIDDCLNQLIHFNNQVSNLMVELKSNSEVINSNNVKVVFNEQNDAFYMSREPIPSNKIFSNKIKYFRQLGLIAFTRESLIKFVELKQSKTEIIESVDMNRFLENNIKINMVETAMKVDAVDTYEDLIRVNNKMKKDKLFKIYSKKYNSI